MSSLDYLCLPRVMASVISVARNRIGLRFFSLAQLRARRAVGGRASEEVPCLVERVHKKRVGMRASNRAAAARRTQHNAPAPSQCLCTLAAARISRVSWTTVCRYCTHAHTGHALSSCWFYRSTAIVRFSLCLKSLLTSVNIIIISSAIASLLDPWIQ